MYVESVIIVFEIEQKKDRFIESKKIKNVFEHYSETKKDFLRYELFNNSRELRKIKK